MFGLLDHLAEILEPLAQLALGHKTETDENHSNNDDPDQETERTLDNCNQEEYAEDRGDYQK